MNTIIAAFCDTTAAQQAVQYLRTQDVTDVQLASRDGDIMNQLHRFSVPDERAQIYAEVARRGAPLVIAHTDHDAARMASELDRFGSLDVEAAEKRWRSEGWNGYDADAVPYDAQACAGEQARLRTENRLDDSSATREGRDLDVIEEQVTIGKREVSRGGARVRTFVVERPVHEDVQLREERIEVTRQPVDERISPRASDVPFTEEEFVVTARGEEAVVGKEARVVERVHVGKTTDTRTESIDETERRTDVQVEPLEGQRGAPDPTRRR